MPSLLNTITNIIQANKEPFLFYLSPSERENIETYLKDFFYELFPAIKRAVNVDVMVKELTDFVNEEIEPVMNYQIGEIEIESILAPEEKLVFCSLDFSIANNDEEKNDLTLTLYDEDNFEILYVIFPNESLTDFSNFLKEED